MVIAEVLALNVRPVLLPNDQLAPDESEIVAAPRVSVAVAVPLRVQAPFVQVWPFTFNVPAVMVRTLELAAMVSELPNCQEPPAPLKVRLPIVLPPKAIDCWVAEVETKDMTEVELLPNV